MINISIYDKYIYICEIYIYMWYIYILYIYIYIIYLFIYLSYIYIYIIYIYIYISKQWPWWPYLVGGIPTPLKNMSSSNGMMTFPTEWKDKIHLPNHQPVYIYGMMFHSQVFLESHVIHSCSKPPTSIVQYRVSWLFQAESSALSGSQSVSFWASWSYHK